MRNNNISKGEDGSHRPVKDADRIRRIKEAATDDAVTTIKEKKKGKVVDAIGIGVIAGLIYYVFPFPAL